MGSVIKVNDVSMMFNLSSEKIDSIKEYFIKAVRRELHFQEFWALRDISFTLEKGDSLGIVGLNGSGKSTLLKIVSGILKPTKGTVETCGSIAPLIELGAGFDANLSARENIYLNGAILGYSRAYMSERRDHRVCRIAGLCGHRREELFLRHGGASRLCHCDDERAGHSHHRRDPRRRRL